jgi:hypothetical protein
MQDRQLTSFHLGKAGLSRSQGQANIVQRLKATIIHLTLLCVDPSSMSASAGPPSSPVQSPAAPCRQPSSLILQPAANLAVRMYDHPMSSVATFHHPTPCSPNPVEIQSIHTLLHSILLPLYSEGPRQQLLAPRLARSSPRSTSSHPRQRLRPLIRCHHSVIQWVSSWRQLLSEQSFECAVPRQKKFGSATRFHFSLPSTC